MQGFVIAGTHSGCGKTTVTLGILAALKKKGLEVQAFKTGPDFIDSGIHRLITGRPSRNLDLWMCGEDYVRDCFERWSRDVDVAVVEGVMGMYDGEPSTAGLAAFLELPIILTVDAYGMAESAGAIVKGFVEYGIRKPPLPPFLGKEGRGEVRSEISFAGVIFNRVASERHYERLKDSVRGIPVLGYLPRDLSFEIPHRHLGLTVAEEDPISDENLNRLADTVLKNIDINAIIRQEARGTRHEAINDRPSAFCPSPCATIAVAYDKAFCFYYEDNLDLLRDSGIEIVRFSPLADPSVPEGVDAVYIGGGYPELCAKELSGNRSMLESLSAWANNGRPIYAECGGLMYLSQGIFDFTGAFFPMAGVFPFETEMKKGRSHLGYREILLKENCILGKKGKRLRGHEFHYSEIVKGQAEGTVPDLRTDLSVCLGGVVESGLSPSARRGIIDEIYSVRNNRGEFVNASGYKFKNTLASYVHIHFGSGPCTAESFAHFVKEKKWKI